MSERTFFSKSNIYPAIWALIIALIGFGVALIWKSMTGPDKVVVLNRESTKDTTITIIRFNPDEQYYNNLKNLTSENNQHAYSIADQQNKKNDIELVALNIAKEYQLKLDSSRIAMQKYIPPKQVDAIENLVLTPEGNPSFYFGTLKRPKFQMPSIVGGYSEGELNSYGSFIINGTTFKRKENIILLISLFDKALLNKITPLFIELDQQISTNNFNSMWSEQYDLKDKKNIVAFSSDFKPGKYILKAGYYLLSEINKKYPTFYCKTFGVEIVK